MKTEMDYRRKTGYSIRQQAKYHRLRLCFEEESLLVSIVKHSEYPAVTHHTKSASVSMRPPVINVTTSIPVTTIDSVIVAMDCMSTIVLVWLGLPMTRSYICWASTTTRFCRWLSRTFVPGCSTSTRRSRTLIEASDSFLRRISHSGNRRSARVSLL